MDSPDGIDLVDLMEDLEETDMLKQEEALQCSLLEWRRQLRRAALRGSEEDVAEVLGRACACHEREVRAAAGRALLDASVYGHAALLRLLLSHGVSVETKLKTMTALHMAAACNRVECVEVLLEHGADLDALDDVNKSALAWAARRGAAECVRFLLERDADNFVWWPWDSPLYNAAEASTITRLPKPYEHLGSNQKVDFLQCVKELCQPKYFNTYDTIDSFYVAIRQGNMDIVQYFVDEVGTLSYKNSRGETALHIASECSNIECIRILVRAGLDINCRENDGRTSLMLAGTCQCVQELLDLGADILASDNDGQTALHYSTLHDDADKMHPLINAGADINAKTNAGETALHLSVRGHNRSCQSASWLLQKGADVNARTLEGRTPLHVAARHWNLSCMEELVQHGADVFARDHEGWLALHCAAAEGFTEGVRFLLHRGLDLEARTAAGETALHLTAGVGGNVYVRKLLRLRPRVNARDVAGRTPLHVAARIHHEDVARALLESGADRMAQDAEGLTPALVADTPAVERIIARWALAA